MWELLGVLTVVGVGVSAGIVMRLNPVLLRRLKSKWRRADRTSLPPSWVNLWPESWLAVKSRNLFAVQTALSLHKPRPCSWLEGFTSADTLFVAPPVRGWILVTGLGLPSPSADVDACFRFVLELSRKLGQVQYFTANRASQHHAWVKAHKGRVVRAYAWGGATLWQQGAPPPGEAELGLRCFAYGEQAPAAGVEASEIMAANGEKVARLAARWGLDPASALQHFPLDELGITGKAAHRY